MAGSISGGAVTGHASRPVMSVMEVELVKEYGKHFGYNPETVDGTMNPGGTMGNIMAVLTARQKYFPHVRMDGWRDSDKPVVYTPA